MISRGAAGAAAALAALLVSVGPAEAAHPNALWHVVHDICVPLRRLAKISAPCLRVDLRSRTAVVPNPRSPTEVLLVPTDRVVGIEDPALLARDAPDYWSRAWAARRYVAQRADRPMIPRDDLAMAINAIPGRSQDQLHIHVDCVRRDVKVALASAAPRLTTRWTPLHLRGGEWRTRRLAGETPTPEPFRLLADETPGAAAEMGAWTLVVAGLSQEAGGGFALLARRVEPGFAGHGEFLLDKRCAVLDGA